jgi:hypothetical protein
MLRRLTLALVLIAPLSVGRADAVTVRDIIELSKAGLSEQVLLALIEVDHTIFTLDASTMKALKDAGVSDNVMLAMIRSGRTPMNTAPEPQPQPQPVAPAPLADPDPPAPEPRVIVIDHHDQPAPQAPIMVPVPVFLPTTGIGFDRGFRSDRVIRTTIPTQDGGAVRANVPIPSNCLKAEPVYWGFGGKLRPDAWQPPPQIICR